MRHRAIPTTGNTGFAVTIVPESDTGPHMAKLGEDRYYKRSGDSFYRMEHFDISDMFGRRHRPSLRLQTRILHAGGSSSSESVETRRVKIILALDNSGRGVARAPYLAFSVPEHTSHTAFGIDNNGSFGLRRLADAGDVPIARYGGSADAVIHAGTTHDVAALDTAVSVRGGRLVRCPPNLLIEYEMAAEGVPVVRDRRTVTSSELLQAVGWPHLDDDASAARG